MSLSRVVSASPFTVTARRGWAVLPVAGTSMDRFGRNCHYVVNALELRLRG